jgi:hypothetical protein
MNPDITAGMTACHRMRSSAGRTLRFRVRCSWRRAFRRAGCGRGVPGRAPGRRPARRSRGRGRELRPAGARHRGRGARDRCDRVLRRAQRRARRPRGVLRDRLGWGAGAALACCVSVALATAVQASVAASVAVAFGWIGLAAFLRTFGRNGGLTGFVTGAIFVITNGIATESLDVADRVLWFGLGAVGGVALMVAAYARDAPPPIPAATPLPTVLLRGARQLRDAVAGDALLRAHALRLASIVAATTLLYRLLGLEHGYWVPLSVLAVLQPDEHASDVRALQRATGTLVGTDRPAHDRDRRGLADGRRSGHRRLRALHAVLARLFLARRAAHADGAAHPSARSTIRASRSRSSAPPGARSGSPSPSCCGGSRRTACASLPPSDLLGTQRSAAG